MSDSVVPDAFRILDMMRVMQSAILPATLTIDHINKQVRILPACEPEQQVKDAIWDRATTGPYGVTWHPPQPSVAT